MWALEQKDLELSHDFPPYPCSLLPSQAWIFLSLRWKHHRSHRVVVQVRRDNEAQCLEHNTCSTNASFLPLGNLRAAVWLQRPTFLAADYDFPARQFLLPFLLHLMADSDSWIRLLNSGLPASGHIVLVSFAPKETVIRCSVKVCPARLFSRSAVLHSSPYLFQWKDKFGNLIFSYKLAQDFIRIITLASSCLHDFGKDLLYFLLFSNGTKQLVVKNL